MKVALQTLLRLLAGIYFILTSLYCLLAFLPYTYCAFIKAPPYAWMPWFTHHSAILYWTAAAAGVIGANPDCCRQRSRIMQPSFLVTLSFFVVGGIYLTARPFLPQLQSAPAAYFWSIASLLPLVVLSVATPPGGTSTDLRDRAQGVAFPYSSGLLVAVSVSMIYALGARIEIYKETRVFDVHSQTLQLAFWSLISHAALAMAILSALNVIYLFAAKTPKPTTIRRWTIGIAIVACLWLILVRFLDNAMSFDGKMASVYALMLSLALTLWGFSCVRPFLTQRTSESLSTLQGIFTWMIIAALAGLALMSRSLIGGEDWNGFVGSAWALIFWIAMSLVCLPVAPVRTDYSLAVILGLFLAGAFVYKSLQLTEILWGKPLGSTDDEISLAFEEYGSHDASFQLAHHVLGNGRHERCGDLCRILREYTNIRDTHMNHGVKLVDQLTPATGERPNIFIFVIDSMRADYLGAYNPRVDYTPNLDALARDSIVFEQLYRVRRDHSFRSPPFGREPSCCIPIFRSRLRT